MNLDSSNNQKQTIDKEFQEFPLEPMEDDDEWVGPFTDLNELWKSLEI